MSLTFEKYISQFENLDKYGEYGERLQEELKDHFEDSTHTGMIFGQNQAQAQEKAIEKLGEAKKIIHEFKMVMKFQNKSALTLESFFLGIISIPVFQFVLLIFSVFTGMYSDDIGIFLPSLGYLISYGISFFVLTIFYLFALKRVFRFLEGKKKNILFALGLFIPPLLFAFIFTDGITSGILFREYLLYILVPAFIAFAGILFFFNKKKESLFKKTQEKKQWQKILSWIPFCISIVLTPLILLTNKGFIPMDSSINRSVLEFFSFLRALFESINVPLIDFHYNGAFGGNEGFYLFGTIYIFLAVVCLYKIIVFFADKTLIKNITNFSWLSFTLLVYIFSLFFLVKVSTHSTNSHTVWHVPVINISDTMKKDLLGFLYTPIIYLKNNSPVASQVFSFYEITSNENYFTITNPDNEGRLRVSYLGFPNSDDSFQDIGKPQGPLLGLELSKVMDTQMSDELFFADTTDLPKTVVCKRDMNKTVRLTRDEDDINYCHELYYQDKLIYTQDQADALYQFQVMSAYPEYALLKFHNSETLSQTVYLIKISK